MLLAGRIISIVIATPGSSPGESRLEDCGCGFVWIASLSLAMTGGIAASKDKSLQPRWRPCEIARRRRVVWTTFRAARSNRFRSRRVDGDRRASRATDGDIDFRRYPVADRRCAHSRVDIQCRDGLEKPAAADNSGNPYNLRRSAQACSFVSFARSVTEGVTRWDNEAANAHFVSKSSLRDVRAIATGRNGESSNRDSNQRRIAASLIGWRPLSWRRDFD